MLDIRQVNIPKQKANICDTILRALPGWFGIENSIVDYVYKAQAMPFWAAFEGGRPIGFIALKVHNPYAFEIYVMGVLEEYQRQGIGKKLVESCELFCVANRTEYLTVKTLDESAASDSYAKTRKFYYAMGFRPLEVFLLHWDKDSPCLFMAKFLSGT